MSVTNKVYNALIDLKYENNSHTKVFRMIDDDAHGVGRVLEAGCAKGYFGEVLKEQGYKVWGVEPSESAYLIAKEKLDYVFHGFIESFFDANKNEKFDHITFGDVIEHLNNPVSVLQQCKNHLTTKGNVICSIPNVSHIAVRTLLMEGRWEYSDMGILDDTHVRFYTRTSVAQLFAQSGYEIIAIGLVRASAEQVDDVGNMKINYNILSQVSKLIEDDDQDVFQIVVKAVPSEIDRKTLEKKNIDFTTKKRLKLLCIRPFVDKHYNVQLIKQLEHWEKESSGELRKVFLDNVQNDDLHWADVAIFTGEITDATYKSLKILQANLIPVVLDIDDWLTGNSGLVEKNDKLRHEINNIINIDVVITSDEQLKNKLQALNNNIYISFNCTFSDSPADDLKQSVRYWDDILFSVNSNDGKKLSLSLVLLKVKSNVLWFGKLITQKKTYQYALDTLKTKGVSGLYSRFKVIIKKAFS